MDLYRQESDRPRKSVTPEQIIAKLRQIEVLIGQGHSVAGRLPGSLESRNRAITAGVRGYGGDPGLGN